MGLRRTLVGVLAVTALFSACGTGETDTAEAVSETVAETGDTAESALLSTVSGGQIDINSLEGSDTILWFWAPW